MPQAAGDGQCSCVASSCRSYSGTLCSRKPYQGPLSRKQRCLHRTWPRYGDQSRRRCTLRTPHCLRRRRRVKHRRNSGPWSSDKALRAWAPTSSGAGWTMRTHTEQGYDQTSSFDKGLQGPSAKSASIMVSFSWRLHSLARMTEARPRLTPISSRPTCFPTRS